MGPRPNKGFVGLKNAGATCYMNSVIQQLYMIPPIRNGILAIEGTGTDVDDEMSGDEKQENEVQWRCLFRNLVVTELLFIDLFSWFFSQRAADLCVYLFT